MALADVNDGVLKLADGRIVTAAGKVVKPQSDTPAGMVRIPSNSEAKAIVAKANRRLADLPNMPREMNTLNVIMMYSLWGLVDQDIAIATGVGVEQIKAIRSGDSYTKLMDEIIKRVIEQDSDRIRGVIQANADRAINKVAELMDSEDEKIALTASRDVLDRAGHRPADIVEHKHTMENTLKIEYIRKAPEGAIPMIDVNPVTGEIVNDGDRS